MAFMCTKGFGECDGCGCCTDEIDEEEIEYRPEDDWEVE